GSTSGVRTHPPGRCRRHGRRGGVARAVDPFRGGAGPARRARGGVALMRARASLWIVLLVIAASLVGGGWVMHSGFRPVPRTSGPRLFEQVFNLVRDRYVDSLPPGDLYELAAAGVMREL